MRALKFKAVVDEGSTLSVTLPPDIPAGTVEVIILLGQSELSSGRMAAVSKSDDSLDELLAFHKDHRLDGLSLQELRAEGRR